MMPVLPSQGQLQSNESVYFQELHQKIDLSNPQLLELTHNNQQFISQIRQLNEIGVDKINSECYKQALVYLNQNQKILEYAASCGKTISHSIIITTLHNEACVHQKLWDLEKSANYLEAIKYNIECSLESMQNNKMQLKQIQHIKSRQELPGLLSYLKKQQSYALYNLQFCAVNSQIRRHYISVKAAKSAISTMKQVLKLMQLLTEIYQVDQTNVKMIKQLAKSDEQLLHINFDEYVIKVRHLMLEHLQRNEQIIKQPQIEHLKVFSIGKLMQLTPIKIEKCSQQKSCEEQLKYSSLVLKVLYMGISYFTVGTELRFISSQNQQENRQQTHKNSEQFIKSQLYHLYAIMVILAYVPIETVFLNHLITSFKNHYGIDFLGEAQAKINEINKSPETPIKSGGLSQFVSDIEFVDSLPQQSRLKSEDDGFQCKSEPINKSNEYPRTNQRNYQYPQNQLHRVSPTFSNHRKPCKNLSKPFKQIKMGTFIRQIDIHHKNSNNKSKSKRSEKSSSKRVRIGNNHEENKISKFLQKKYCIYTMRKKRDTNGSSSNGNSKSRKSSQSISKRDINCMSNGLSTSRTKDKVKSWKKLTNPLHCLGRETSKIRLTHNSDGNNGKTNVVMSQRRESPKQKISRGKNKSNEKRIVIRKIGGNGYNSRK